MLTLRSVRANAIANCTLFENSAHVLWVCCKMRGQSIRLRSGAYLSMLISRPTSTHSIPHTQYREITSFFLYIEMITIYVNLGIHCTLVPAIYCNQNEISQSPNKRRLDSLLPRIHTLRNAMCVVLDSDRIGRNKWSVAKERNFTLFVHLSGEEKKCIRNIILNTLAPGWSSRHTLWSLTSIHRLTQRVILFCVCFFKMWIFVIRSHAVGQETIAGSQRAASPKADASLSKMFVDTLMFFWCVVLTEV